MNLEGLFSDVSKRSKAKVAEISAALLDGRLTAEEWLAFAADQSAVNKATYIEGLEAATRKKPDLVNGVLFGFLTTALDDEEPRVKWESARVIGNVAALLPDGLGAAIEGLVRDASHEGTVVRWAAAGALEAVVRAAPDRGRELKPILHRAHLEEKYG